MRAFCIVVGGVLLAACSSAADPVPVPDGCDPIVPEHCGFPFPNDLWRDSTGHVAFGTNTLPVPVMGKPLDPKTFLTWRDGFSPGEMAMTFLPGATATGMPDSDHIADSIQTTSPTILMEADTGVLVPHFSEIDVGMFHDDDDDAIMIHPVQRLKDGTRYIAAIRNIVDGSGVVIPPSAAFQALRDSRTTQDPVLESRRAHFEDVFRKLQVAGIERRSLQLAWDYTTATQANTTGDLLAMRDDALATVGAQGPTFTIDKVDVAPSQYLAKVLHGTMTVPLYLSRPDVGDDEHIVRDASGKPMKNGTAQVPFVVLIPPSATDVNPASLLQNGHGLLGSMDEGWPDGYFAQTCGTTTSASPWTGPAWRTTTTRRSSTRSPRT